MPQPMSPTPNGFELGALSSSAIKNPSSAGETGRYRDRVPPRPAATINNRRARYDYLVIDTYECGLVLKGAEVKSIREGKAHLREAYARVQDHEVVLYGMHVAPYSYSQEELDPIRPRKLLLHQREIDEIDRAVAEKGVTLVPLRLYFKDGRAKIELAIARGKRSYDKRHAIAERDAKRDTDRAMRDRAKGERD